MKKFKTMLAIFMGGLPFGSHRVDAALIDEIGIGKDDEISPIDLRPLNLPGENLFAAHRSHSSHGSHGSHRSSSGGGGAYKPPSPTRVPSPSSSPVDPGRPSVVSPRTVSPAAPVLSSDEKLKLQVMRVQLALSFLGLYKGTVDGVFGDDTKQALKHFQTVKELPADGLMNTDTLNALGVQAVQ